MTTVAELASTVDVRALSACDDLRPWVHPALYRARSAIHGAGVFTERVLLAGELVVRWRGTIVPRTDGATTGASGAQQSAVSIAEGVVLASLPGHGVTIDDYMNHSCAPNIGMLDAVTLVTVRDIASGEELTADYAFWTANDGDVVIERCACGLPGCRKRVTGCDWRDPALQGEFGEYFAPFIQRRIARLWSQELANA
jgi:hypothetical protein